ncbi:MAG: mechanosensitive ion channel family protein [Actinobacteria bacterium]|nr:MAG: mechanosensitive ion channel family protein [Actinomycetota bacterium]
MGPASPRINMPLRRPGGGMGMMGALVTPLLAVSLPWATPSPQPTVTVTQTASPVPSAAGVTAEQVAEVQHSFWFKALQWFLGVPLQILIVVVVTIIVIGVSHRLIDRTVKKISDREAEVDEEEEPDRVRRDREQFGEALLNQRRTQRASAIGSLLRSIVTAVAVGIAILTILPFLGINIGPLLTSAGVLGVALGFGAQNLVKDYLSGIYIVLEDQYGVGDMVEVGNVVGRVEEVTLRVTRLRDQTGVVWYIRNGEILTVANRSQGWTLAFADIPIAADVDLERVRAAVATVAEQMMADPELDDSLLDEPRYAGVESVSGEAVVVRVVAKAAPTDQTAVSRELRARIKQAFDADGIRIPTVIRLPGSPEAIAGGKGSKG